VADITVSVSSPGQISTWGQSSWGNGSWNIFNGVSLSSASVTVDAEIAIGWGGQAWNIGTWGDVASTGANLTGISLSSNIGSVEFSGSLQGWGRPSWGTAAWGLFGTVLAGGQQLSIQILKQPVEAKTRKLQARWTFEAAQDAQSMHGIDVEAEVMAALAEREAGPTGITDASVPLTAPRGFISKSPVLLTRKGESIDCGSLIGAFPDSCGGL